MREAVLRRIFRAVFGGGSDISAANPLPVTSEVSLDNGVATSGTDNTLIDTTRGWQDHIWEDAIVEILDVSTGISYVREIDDNDATTLNFATHSLPVAVVEGDTYSIRRVVSPLNPLARAEVHNVAVGAGADILAAALAPLNTPCTFRVEVAFDAAGILNVTITRGVVPVTVTEHFNGGVALNNDSLYRFNVMVHAGDTINYQYSVACNCLSLRCQEIIAAAE